MTRNSFPFLKYRPITMIISAVIILSGLISLFISGLNLGVDFTGGTILHLKLEDNFLMEDVRAVLAPYGLDEAALQRAGGAAGHAGGDEVIIKTRYLDEAIRKDVINSFMERWPDMTTENVLRVENVGAVVGGELTREAFLALIIAAICIVIYITLRFEFRFSIAAVAALLHDALFIVAIFSIFKIEVNSPFIAAILTIIGYSINNTIVIFDRIRENLKFRRQRSIEELVNDSINETLTRTINTSVTTLIVLLSLFFAFNYFVGGIDLKAFALALLIGVIVGTYSSIFIAGALWVAWRKKGAHEEKRPASA